MFFVFEGETLLQKRKEDLLRDILRIRGVLQIRKGCAGHCFGIIRHSVLQEAIEIG